MDQLTPLPYVAIVGIATAIALLVVALARRWRCRACRSFNRNVRNTSSGDRLCPECEAMRAVFHALMQTETIIEKE